MADEKEIKNKSNPFKFAHGRRKEAVARVRLFKGKGQSTVNAKPFEEYFPLETFKSNFMKPFRLTKTEGQYYVTIKVTGSGTKGQLDACVHGISQVLNVENREEFRPVLKRAGLLTRDARVKERRKYGRAQKARKGKQSPKR